MTRYIHIYEDGERTGRIDVDAPAGEYDGDDQFLADFLAHVTEAEYMDVEHSEELGRSSASRSKMTGEELISFAVPIIENQPGVTAEVVEEDDA